MRIYVLITTLLLTSGLFAQSSLKGQIKDEQGQPIYGANVFISDLQKGTTSDSNGNLLLTDIKEGVWKVTFSMVGFQTVTKEITFAQNSTVEIVQVLKENEESLKEVVVFRISFRDTSINNCGKSKAVSRFIKLNNQY
ncbi:carboxypeptidase-like regulatory domain-containing protein [Tenacibaculum sp. L6]|uniref:carboxypeptidase-like regulatory domain-containing protein n=1 Tax=Tenacibaculum sp. L6 TaxID=2992764 RepID=UPI00237A25B7|nr:carboxypeptidase-like regulatory domain-containing protein [Tenacibaculum sp. L6]MDE0535355.1 carboxypeptidase-like regulatory domain-containing protein [Tenacibaculum sp. L6]